MKIPFFLFIRTKIMDPLSDVLSLLKVKAMLTARMETKGQWAMRFPGYRHIKFGAVLDGNLWLWMNGVVPQLLEKGDFYLLTSGEAYFCGSDPGVMVSDGVEDFAAHREDDGVVRYGIGAKTSEVVGGKFVFDEMTASLLLRHIPPVLIMRNTSENSPALAALMTMISHETQCRRPGYDVAACSIATIVLVQMLREHLVYTQKDISWLTALRDQKIGPVLSLIHGAPGEEWTLEKMATAAAMSRSAFSRHFIELTGSTPGSYLTSWRMELASAELRKRNRAISEIALLAGYRSVPAFSLAFRRHTGIAPGAYRSQYCR